MAEQQQNLGQGPVDLMTGPVKVPDGLPLTISYARKVDLYNPKDVFEWVLAQIVFTRKPVNVVVDHTTREVRPSPGAAKTG